MSLSIDLYQTLALSVVAVWIGLRIRSKVPFFERFCIPAPVISAFAIQLDAIDSMGGIFLNLFLGIAMITLELWQLAALALPLIALLAVQTAFMALFARFVLFPLMGHDYDAAVISAGTCGFGLGATPNAMANMQAVCDKYVPSVKAFLLVPVVGGFILDFVNSLLITLFVNII